MNYILREFERRTLKHVHTIHFLVKKKLLKPGITYENSNFVRLFFKNANFENYDYIAITIKDNDNDFIIHAVAGMIDDDNHDWR